MKMTFFGVIGSQIEYFFRFWNFWVSRSILDWVMGQKPSKIDFLAKWRPFFSLQSGPESTDFGFFGLVGFLKAKSWFPEIFRSPGQFWTALELSEPKSPKKGSPRDIKRKRNYAALNDRNSNFFFIFAEHLRSPRRWRGCHPASNFVKINASPPPTDPMFEM